MNDEIMRLVIIGLIAYALGNINPSIIIGKIYGVDIRKEGSGNAGTTNTIRVIGLTAGLICLAVDILKAFAAVTIGYNMGDVNGSMVAFACVVLGHCFPALWKFKGGKGVAAAFGAALALNWPSAIAAFFVAAIMLLITRRMSVGSIAAALAYPVLIWYYEPECLYFAIGAAVFLLIMHISNITRLSKGQEKALTFGHRTLADRGKPVETETDHSEAAAEEPDDIEADTVMDTGAESETGTAAEISVADNPLTEEELQELGEDVTAFEDMESGESPIAADATQEPVLVKAQTQEAVRPEPEPMDYYAGTVIPDLGDDACRIAVIGNGSFGTAMANLLVYNGHDVTLYGRNSTDETFRDSIGNYPVCNICRSFGSFPCRRDSTQFPGRSSCLQQEQGGGRTRSGCIYV